MVVEIIRQEFVVDEARSLDKFDDLDAKEFGYRSIHLIVSSPRTREHTWKNGNAVGLRAEVQVRSILQHAWSNMSHKFE